MSRTCVVCDQPIRGYYRVTPDGPVDVVCLDIYTWKPGRSLDEIRAVAQAADAAVNEIVARVTNLAAGGRKSSDSRSKYKVTRYSHREPI